jgi:hypothetical protein
MNQNRGRLFGQAKFGSRPVAVYRLNAGRMSGVQRERTLTRPHIMWISSECENLTRFEPDAISLPGLAM